MTDGSAASIGYFTGISPNSLVSVTVEDLQDTRIICGLDVVFVGGPDWFAILSPAHIDPGAGTICTVQQQGLAESESGVFQLF